MCCGRTTIHRRPASRRRSAAPGRSRSTPPPPADGRFEYTGPTRLTVRGPATGRTYVWPATGAVVRVEPPDAAALAAVPGLRAAGAGPAPAR